MLGKYPADYLQCKSCGFVQTSDPHWLNEAYSSAITSLDIGLLDRNIWLREQVTHIIDAFFPEAKIFLDYAGGYGAFTRMMRDRGFNFFRQDPYCENIFAKHFDLTDVNGHRFDVLTAFEVFEHFADPMPELEKMLSFSRNIIFSTVLLPADKKQIEDWWYIAEETGQHVAFYSEKTLEFMAAKHGLKYYTNHNNLHVFTSQCVTPEQLLYAFNGVTEQIRLKGLKTKVINLSVKRESLLQKDFEWIKNKLNNGG